MDQELGFIIKRDEELKENKFSTQCTNCAFATFNHPEYNDQTGCALNRIEQFKKQGALISSQYYPEDSKVYYVIEDRICNCLRFKDSWPGREMSLEQEIALVEKEIEIRSDIILLINATDTIEDIQKMNYQIGKMTLKPKKVWYSNLNPKIKPIHLIKSIKKSKVNNLEWGLFDFVLKKQQSIPYQLDYIVNDITNNYYTVFQVGQTIKEDFLEKINNFINVDLVKFSILKSNNFPNGIFIPTALHKNPVVVGHAHTVYKSGTDDTITVCENLVHKIEFLARTLNQNHMVRNIEDIVC